jgi:hypothetical protein
MNLKEENIKKKTIRILPILSQNNIFEKKDENNSIYISENKPLDDNLAIDLLMRDQSTQTNFHSPNKTTNNFYNNSNNLNDSFNSKKQNTYFEKMMRKKIENDNKKLFKLDLKHKINLLWNHNDIFNGRFFNPLIYDDFERKYNTLKYFIPSNSDNEINSYRIHFSSNNEKKTKKKVNIQEMNFSDNQLNKTKKKLKDKKFYNSIDFSTTSDFKATEHKQFNEKLKNIYYNNKRFKKLYKILNDNKKKVH